MNARTLIWRSLWFYRRTHLGAGLGTAVAAAVLIGALAVGDSLRASLRTMALSRLGEVQTALAAPDRFFPDGLAGEISASLQCRAAPVLWLAGSAENRPGTARANQVTVLGVDERFWGLYPAAPLQSGDEPGQVVVNEALARRLDLQAGDTLYLRLPRPDMLPAEAALSGAGRRGLSLALTVKAVAGDDQFGRFSLRSGAPPLNAFVPIRWLQQKADLAGLANVLLAGGTPEGQDPSARAGGFLQAYPDRVRLFGLQVRQVGSGDLFEVRSRRIFLDPPLEQALRGLASEGVLTYFVNELRGGNLATPYSMVAGIGPMAPEPNSPAAAVPPAQGRQTAGLKDDEILLTDWLAEDLAARPGDRLDLAYYVLGPRGELHEQTSRLRVAGGKPLDANQLDPGLMPDFPGLAEANECSEWEPGIPIDAGRIRKKDEQYWRQRRGTPKAVVPLAAAQKMWGNRYGRLTAVRFSVGSVGPDVVVNSVLAALPPAELGLVFRPVRQEAIEAAEKSMDFGWLFAGMSVFLIVSALLLTGLLMGLSARQRAGQVGTLLAMGFTPGRVRRLLLCEGILLAAAGVAVGAGASLAYGRGVLAALRAFLPAGMDAADLRFHVSLATIGRGAAMGLAMAAGAMWLVLRRMARSTVHDLLSAEGATGRGRLSRARGGRWALAASLVLVVCAVLDAILGSRQGGRAAAMVFFSAGALLLAGGVGMAYWLLCGLAGRHRGPAASLRSLGASNGTRSLGRSLAVVAMLACGTFVVVGAASNWRGGATDPYDRASGTGGFALLATSAAPLPGDPFAVGAPAQGRQPASAPRGVSVVSIRVRLGDEASCLNLSRPQQPAVWGVDANSLSERGAFSFSALASGFDRRDRNAPWMILEQAMPDGAVPAIADEATLEWALGVGVGDAVTIQDEQGRPVRLRIVASLAASILQGGLLISPAEFVRLFPSAGGYRMFLIDAPPDRLAETQKALASNRLLQDAGLEVVRTSDRQAQFAAVENAYLSMFQVLGGLGVLLGTVGLGLLVFRNVMERRGELALLRAVGFSRRQVRGLVLWEHWLLQALGLVGGAAAGLLAVLPALGAGGAAAAATGVGGSLVPRFPWPMVAGTLLAIAASSLAWTWAAAAIALRGDLVAALRNE